VPSSPLKILIADDSPINAKLLEAVVRKLGHQAILAADGLEAVDRFFLDSPDLVFMDIMMPGMDGLSAVREIRARPATKWVPIIFYSALDSMEDIVLGLESGGDDYVVKPASLPLLRAKINGYARLLGIQHEINAYSEELKNWRAVAEEQSRLGAHVMSRLTDAEGLRDTMLQYFNIPADTFSGDLLCAARAPGDVMNVMLADASGHGLAAALTAMPLTQAFYSMTAKGFPLASIAEELNRKLKAILPSDRFVAATLAAVDVRNQTVEIWNGGNPDALFINSEGEVLCKWVSQHPPLGILPDKLFSGLTETMEFHEPGDLVLCSDGLVEAETPEGEWLALTGVARLLGGAAAGVGRFERLLQGLHDHLQAPSGRDDISCMVLNVPIERRRQLRLSSPGVVNRASVEDWRLDIAYSAHELRYLDVVPAVLGFISQVSMLKPHQGALFLIVSELFNNALDHGLLGLDSAIKDQVGGFESYLQQRAERLVELAGGHISLAFQIHQENAQAVLDISIQDSGPGFDHAKVTTHAPVMDKDEIHAYGRGIALVRSLCAQLVYSGTGNKVWARYVLGNLDAPEGGEEGKEDQAASPSGDSANNQGDPVQT
jgi:CheY-like chemotaxis protein/anti-sigma regulatory factor (Ser/Thr protein kinase)